MAEYSICKCKTVAGEVAYLVPMQIRHDLTPDQIDEYIDDGWEVCECLTGDLMEHS